MFNVYYDYGTIRRYTFAKIETASETHAYYITYSVSRFDRKLECSGLNTVIRDSRGSIETFFLG